MAKRGIFCLLIVVIGIVLVVGWVGRSTTGANDDFSFDAAKLSDTTVWTKVNEKPYMMGAFVSFLCGMPTTKRYEAERKKNPHAESFITVYVNKSGKDAMFAKDAVKFPEGSIIVKEKIGHANEGSKPLLYTIMRKRQPGYNPDLGDWEFAVVGPNGKDIQGRGKLENCQKCHRPKRDSDYVFRPYLTSN